MRNTSKSFLYFILSIAIAATFATSVCAQECPYAFKLGGGKIDDPWKKVTDSEWSAMLPKGWQDKGFHFYSRIRERGPSEGIATPSDLESEIMKQTADLPEGTIKNRRQIVLPIANAAGRNLRVIYDYAGGTDKCSLVTLTY